MSLNLAPGSHHDRGFTRAKFLTFEYKWEIDNLSIRPDWDKDAIITVIESPQFPDEQAAPQVVWRMLLYPTSDGNTTGTVFHNHHSKHYHNFITITRRDIISLFVKLVSCPPEVQEAGLKAKCRLSILDSSYKPVFVKPIDTYTLFKVGTYVGHSDFLERAKVFDPTNNFLSNDTLILQCEICVYVGESSNPAPLLKVPERDQVQGNKDDQIKNPEVDQIIISEDHGNKYDKIKAPENQKRLLEARHSENFCQFLDSKQYCDVILTLRGHEFKCHRVVLAARSTVFREDFERALATDCPDTVEVRGELEPAAFMDMIRFIYTGEVASDLARSAAELLKSDIDRSDVELGQSAIARSVVELGQSDIDRSAVELLKCVLEYKVDQLKARCEDALCSTLKAENAVERLILAHTYSAQQLKSRVTEFICNNYTELSKTTAWKQLAERHPKIGYDILSLVYERKLQLAE